jgi:hypothetical protein
MGVKFPVYHEKLLREAIRLQNQGSISSEIELNLLGLEELRSILIEIVLKFPPPSTRTRSSLLFRANRLRQYGAIDPTIMLRYQSTDELHSLIGQVRRSPREIASSQSADRPKEKSTEETVETVNGAILNPHVLRLQKQALYRWLRGDEAPRDEWLTVAQLTKRIQSYILAPEFLILRFLREIRDKGLCEAHYTKRGLEIRFKRTQT